MLLVYLSITIIVYAPIINPPMYMMNAKIRRIEATPFVLVVCEASAGAVSDEFGCLEESFLLCFSKLMPLDS